MQGHALLWRHTDDLSSVFWDICFAVRMSELSEIPFHTILESLQSSELRRLIPFHTILESSQSRGSNYYLSIAGKATLMSAFAAFIAA